MNKSLLVDQPKNVKLVIKIFMSNNITSWYNRIHMSVMDKLVANGAILYPLSTNNSANTTLLYSILCYYWYEQPFLTESMEYKLVIIDHVKRSKLLYHSLGLQPDIIIRNTIIICRSSYKDIFCIIRRYFIRGIYPLQ